MKALIEFIEQYRPGFSQEVVPADEIDLALLEEHAGPLPGAYRRFLQTMGASMGDLELAEANFSINGGIGTYQTMRWLRHGRFIYVAGDDGLAAWDYFLDRSRPHGVDDCMLVRMPLNKNFPPEASHPKHVGLEEFLYFAAFQQLRLPLLSHRWEFSSPEDSIAAALYRPDLVSSLAEQHGFQRLPPATHCALYERGDAALLLYRHPTLPTFSFTLAGEDSPEMQRLARDFEARLGLKGRAVK
jgi:hypothetical protein